MKECKKCLHYTRYNSDPLGFNDTMSPDERFKEQCYIDPPMHPKQRNINKDCKLFKRGTLSQRVFKFFADWE